MTIQDRTVIRLLIVTRLLITIRYQIVIRDRIVIWLLIIIPDRIVTRHQSFDPGHEDHIQLRNERL